MKVTQTDTEVTIVFDKDSKEYKYGFLPLIEIASMANPGMTIFANDFKSMIKVLDPKEQMAKTWDESWDKTTDACMDQMIADNSHFAELISKFYNQIGEGLGPVSYAGFELRRWFREDHPDDIRYQDWVDECIYLYSISSLVK